MNKELTIKKTVDLDLCVSCGICKVMCPSASIDMVFSQGQYLPQVSDECTDCGSCLEVCPGAEVRFKDIYQNEQRELPEDIYLGHVIDSYVCYTKDEHIRKKAASGGMITSLIVELMDSGLYQGAFVLPFENAATELAKVVYTEDTDRIIAASKSKYLPASVENVVLKIEDLKVPVVVGTSCQIHGIKQYCMHKAIDCSHVLFMGLFCEKTLNYNLLSYYRWKYGKGREFTSFDYRNKEKNGWPGHTKVTLSNGEEEFIDKKVRMSLKQYFQLYRCLFCIDKLNQLADISFGDCYIKGEETKLGQSNILVRTEKGKHALDAAKEMFVLKQVVPYLIASSQKIEEKQKNLNFCHLLADKYEHIIYPDIQQVKQQKTAFDRNIGSIEKEYHQLSAFIDLGRTTSKFSKIDGNISRGNLKKVGKKLVAMAARKVGVRK